MKQRMFYCCMGTVLFRRWPRAKPCVTNVFLQLFPRFFPKCSFPTGFSRVLLQLEEHLIGHSLWRPRVLSTLIHAVNPSSFLNFIEIFNPCLIFAFSRALILDLESAFFHSYWTPFGFLRADPRALTHVSQAISISIFFEHFSSFLTFLNFNVPMRGARSFHIAEWPIAFCTRIHVLMIQGSLLYMLDLWQVWAFRPFVPRVLLVSPEYENMEEICCIPVCLM